MAKARSTKRIQTAEHGDVAVDRLGIMHNRLGHPIGHVSSLNGDDGLPVLNLDAVMAGGVYENATDDATAILPVEIGATVSINHYGYVRVAADEWVQTDTPTSSFTDIDMAWKIEHSHDSFKVTDMDTDRAEQILEARTNKAAPGLIEVPEWDLVPAEAGPRNPGPDYSAPVIPDLREKMTGATSTATIDTDSVPADEYVLQVAGEGFVNHDPDDRWAEPSNTAPVQRIRPVLDWFRRTFTR